ncbi:cell envelope integrity EipB family protein [Lichenihabitans psoromatis]|uniref:cell envelope integrity EipB family protein n=1 Tax=Lichenihabitans psoromatis TaxID=2528642 RepID=UPI001FE0A88C|nr:cell envelope integrity EipB family protein [Lichenihabitans psoromatis]
MRHPSAFGHAARILALGAFVQAVASGPASAAEVQSIMPLAAHHAVYKLSLLKASGAKAPEAVDGLLSYDFTGSACDGYAMTLRQMTALQPQEGESRVSEMQTASFEGGDSHDYRFRVATKGDSSGPGDINGTAHKSADGDVSVALQQPKPEKIDLASGVLFPTEHLKKVVATAKAGGKILTAAVFDGSDTGKKVFNTLTVIGTQTDVPPTEKAAQIDALKTVHRWPVAISYFDASKTDSAPDYVLSFDLYENGISRALRLDYGDFVLAGDLTDLKLMPDTPCKN